MKGFGEVNFVKELPKDFEIVSDQLLLQSVLQNLIHNAINYRGAEAPWIKITARKNDDAVEIEVADNGLGIPPDIKDKVFNMFYRGHPDSSGSGLGLFIVKNAVDKLQGHISFDSKLNIGTCFKVTLPHLTDEKISS
jgi:signal transduction histidine kinase